MCWNYFLLVKLGSKKMSVKITCQYTGLEFEAATRRSKNHPKISAWLQSANTDGWYNQALAAIQAGREAGFTSISEYINLLSETEKAAKAGIDAEIEKRVLEFRQRKADAAARQEAYYASRANGTWQPKEHLDNISNRENENEIPVRNVTSEPEW